MRWRRREKEGEVEGLRQKGGGVQQGVSRDQSAAAAVVDSECGIEAMKPGEERERERTLAKIQNFAQSVFDSLSKHARVDCSTDAETDRRVTK